MGGGGEKGLRWEKEVVFEEGIEKPSSRIHKFQAGGATESHTGSIPLGRYARHHSKWERQEAEAGPT